jgi:prolyl 4-hydroxylase
MTISPSEPLAAERFKRAVRLAFAGELAAAREDLALAAQGGSPHAGVLYSAFLAGGLGGPRDWPAAVELLRAYSEPAAFAASQLALIDAMSLTRSGDPVSIAAPRSLHAAKRIELFQGLLTPAECAFLTALAEPRLKPSTILRSDGTLSTSAAVRDSDVAPLDLLASPTVLHAITRRIAVATGTVERHGEPFEVMRYAPGQQYRPHLDGAGRRGNDRILTAIVYLNEDYEGGETAFTELGIKVRGRTGDMLLFRNLGDDGEVDRDMRHAGLPVADGLKFIATRWIRQRPFFDAQGHVRAEALWA